jgi:galactokinase
MSRPLEIAASFRERFNASPDALAFAPGRVNLIGEHTDYNDGFVLPMAIQFGVHVAGRLTDSGRVKAVSTNFPDHSANFPVAQEPQDNTWDHFLRSVITELAVAGIKPDGLELLISGDVPDGAGLSSSAAFSVALAMLVADLVGKPWRDPVALARLCQAAEHRNGVMCGLLDQMASAACLAGSAMLLDCRDLSRRMIPIDRDKMAVLVGDTGVKRALTDGRYNQRRIECEAAARELGVPALRDLTEATFDAAAGHLSESLRRRARHVVTENARVQVFAAALEAGNYQALGPIADAGHFSLRDDFEVSCPELDAMAEAFRAAGAWGARMVGAGFGGAAIALVDPAEADAIAARAAATYRAMTGREGAIHLVAPGAGARVTREIP